MGTARKAAAALTPAEQRAQTLEHLITLNMGLNNGLDALEIARDTAATPVARQQAENEIPAIGAGESAAQEQDHGVHKEVAWIGNQPAKSDDHRQDPEAFRGPRKGGRADR